MKIKTYRTNTGYAQLMTADRHTLVSDVNTALGGTDLGPNPHDFYDAALASCTAITVSMYAKRKNIPLEEFSVEIESDRSHEKEGQYHLSRRLSFGGDQLSQAQKDELLAIAGKCPLHKLMTDAKVTIDTALAG